MEYNKFIIFNSDMEHYITQNKNSGFLVNLSILSIDINSRMAITKLLKNALDSSVVTAAKVVDGVLVVQRFTGFAIASDRLAGACYKCKIS